MLTTEVPQVTATGRYPITKAAEKLGINRTTLNRLARKNLIKFSIQKATHRKIFTGAELLRFWNANA